MTTPSIEEATETYERTVRDCEMDTWAGWVRKIHYALESNTELNTDGMEEWAIEVYKVKKAEHKVSMADEIK